jgi:hypothetical protein
VLTLDDEQKAITDMTGKYSFRHAATGEHEIAVDLNSIPAYYLPQVPLKNKIALFEGVSYIYNVPLEKTEEETQP